MSTVFQEISSEVPLPRQLNAATPDIPGSPSRDQQAPLQLQSHAAQQFIRNLSAQDEAVLEIPGHRPQPREVAGVPITVLTTDAEFFAAVRVAVTGEHPLFIANDLEDAATFAATGRCPILITDQTLDTLQLTRITKPLRQHDPALVVIAVGTPSDDIALKRLVSSRIIDRYLLKPATPALTRLMIESVAREYRWRNAHNLADPCTTDSAPTVASPTRAGHSQAAWPENRVAPPAKHAKSVPHGTSAARALPAEALPGRTAREPHGLPRPPWIVVIAVVAAVAAGVWWTMLQRLPDIDPRNVIATNLSAAQQALAEGRYIDPPERSALHYYSAVLALDPMNAKAKSGIDSMADHLIADARRLIAARRFAEAVVALEGLRRTRPDHRQLPALEAQLRKELETQLLYAGEAVNTLDPLQDSPIVAALTQATGQTASDARSSQQVTSRNAAAQTDLREVHTRILLEANEAIALGHFDAARQLIGEAEDRGVPIGEIAALSAALVLSLDTAQRSREKGELLQLALQRTSQGRLIEPAQDSARHYLDRLMQTDRKFPGLQQGIDALGGQLVTNAQAATNEKNFDLATHLLSQARDIGFAGTDLYATEATLRAARIASAMSPAIVPPAEPRLIKLVEPEYPAEARLRGIEGWVDLSLIVAVSGNVVDPRVENSSMNHLFGRAALAAVRQWKYEPRSATDSNLDKRVNARVRFRLQDQAAGVAGKRP